MIHSMRQPDDISTTANLHEMNSAQQRIPQAPGTQSILLDRDKERLANGRVLRELLYAQERMRCTDSANGRSFMDAMNDFHDISSCLRMAPTKMT